MRTRGWRSVAALLAALAMLAVACGGDDDDSSSDDGASAAEEADPNGVVRIGYDMSVSGGFHFDPTAAGTATFLPMMLPVYDTLLHRQPDDTYEPGLASDVTIVDPRTITIELREDLTFTDGTPLDAEAVKFTLERNVASGNRTGLRLDQLTPVERIEITSPTTLTLHLNADAAGFVYPVLGDAETSPVSPTAVRNGVDLKTNPVGAGPFTLRSMDIGSKVVFEKNPDYYDADNILLAGLEYVQVTPQARANAFNSGAVNYLGSITQQDAGELGPNAVITERPSNIPTHLGLCAPNPLWQDIRVRQALNYAIDRDAINQLLYEGKGEPAWGLWPEGHRYHNPDLEGVYEKDIDKAKQLLAQAGVPNGFRFTSYVSPSGQATPQLAEVVQAQLREIGVEMEILVSPNVLVEYFQEQRQAAFLYLAPRPGIDKMTRNFQKSAALGGGLCIFPNADLDRVIAQLKAVPEDSDEAVELWQEGQRIIIEDQVGFVFLTFIVEVTAWEDSLGDVRTYTGPLAAPVPIFNGMYVKK